ncbi:MAG: hypothetical protein ABFQ95_01645 [Pseudomonadota bacterium]
MNILKRIFNQSFCCWLVLISFSWSQIAVYATSIMPQDPRKRTAVIFAQQDNGTDELLGRMLHPLDRQSLSRASQVSWRWHDIVEDVRKDQLCDGKRQLYSLILEVTDAQANEVQRAREQLSQFLQHKNTGQNPDKAFVKRLQKILTMLRQPEDLIINLRNQRESLIANSSSQHSALARLRQVIETLDALISEKTDLADVLEGVSQHYHGYLQAFDTPGLACDQHIKSKAILTGEHFLNTLSPRDQPANSSLFGVPIRSYRISQSMALNLLSQDQHGLCIKKNQEGSHPVSFFPSSQQENLGVHFKANMGTSDLPVGQESAIYWFSKVLFGRGMAPSALVTLNNVNILSPAKGSPLHSQYIMARSNGQTSSQFFAEHFGAEQYFTEPDPTHVLQASYHIAGPGLHDFIDAADKNLTLYQQLDARNFSEQFLISLLTNPEDGKPDNFRVQKDSKGRQHITGIDNDMALIAPVVSCAKYQGATKLAWHKIGVKNILYCLPAMNTVVAPEVIARLKTLHPEQFVLQWLQQLLHDHQGYHNLTQQGYTNSQGEFGANVQPYLIQDLYQHSLKLPVKIPPQIVQQLSQTLRKVQLSLEDNRALTHWQLFYKVQSLAARFYRAMINSHQDESVHETYKYIHAQNHHDARYEEKYLEEVLNLEEQLPGKTTVAEALAQVTARPSEQDSFIAVNSAYKQILKNVNALQTSRYYLTLAVDYLQNQQALTIAPKHASNSSNDSTISLHDSWYRDGLLLQALSWHSPIKVLVFLLEQLQFDAGVVDDQKDYEGWNSLRHAVVSHYPPMILDLLKQHYQQQHPGAHALSAWLNRKALDRRTALDIALQEKSDVFNHLIQIGCSHCSETLALKFYQHILAKQTSHFIPAFVQLMQRNQAIRWRICLETLFPTFRGRKHLGAADRVITTASYTQRVLPKIIAQQFLKADGGYLAYTQNGNHLVCQASLSSPLQALNSSLNLTHGVYLKVFPELPGIEEAVGILTRRILGFGAPHVEMIKLPQSGTAKINTPILLSHAMGSKEDTLGKFLNRRPDFEQHLDQDSLSGMILMAMLANPEDGKPDNYVVEPHPTKPGKYRVVGVDNDHAFVPAIVRETAQKTFWTRRVIPVAQVKTILYCFGLMSKPVPTAMRQLFINLRPIEILTEWLRELKKINNNYTGLFEKDKDRLALFENQECFLGVPFQTGAISHLYNKMTQLRDILTQDPSITHIDVLSKLEPRLAKRYRLALLNKSASPLDRFKQVDVPFYQQQQDGSFTTQTKSGDILKSMDIPLQESVFESMRTGKGYGPSEALKELETIKEQTDQKSLEGLLAQIRGGQKLNIFKTLTVESTRAEFLKALNFKKLNPSAQEAVLGYLQGKELREAHFKNCSVLTDSHLQSLQSNHLRHLNLKGCNRISNASIKHLANAALALEVLNLSHIGTLKEIGDISRFSDAALSFNQLKTLALNHCVKLTKLLITAPKLKYLNISQCARLKDSMLDTVIEQSPELKKLDLKGCSGVSEHEFRRLYPSLFLQGLLPLSQDVRKIIEVIAQAQDQSQDQLKLNLYRKLQNIDPEMLSFIARLLSSRLTNLTSLRLGSNNIGDTGAKALALLNNLTSLDLYGNKIGDTGAKALALLNNLTSLDLRSNKIGDTGAKALTLLTNLTSLNLWSNEIGDEGAKALTLLTNLTSLNLWSNEIGYEGAKALTLLTNLTSLELWGNKIGDEGAKALTLLTNLTSLDLRYNEIGDAGAKALSLLTNLTSLELYGNEIGDAGAKALALLTNLTSLDLQSNNIGDAGAKALTLLTNLTLLGLQSNNIGYEGAKALTLLTNLTWLYLGYNEIGDAGAKALTLLTNLTSLNIGRNKIGDEGAKALTLLTNLTSLGLRWNKIGDPVKARLRGEITCKNLQL